MLSDPDRNRRSWSRCPTCGARFNIALTEAMPFCSTRCQQVDLGRWMNEEYGLPVEPDEDAWDMEESSNDLV